MKTAIFIESDKHLGAESPWFESLTNRSAEVLTLDESAEWALRQKGIPYIPVDSFSDRTIEYSLAHKHLRETSELADLIDRHYSRNIGAFRAGDLHPGRSELRFLKVLFDTVNWRIELLLRVLDQVQPQDILVLHRENRASTSTVSKRGLYFDDESLYSMLLRLIAETSGLPHRSAITPEVQDHGYTLKRAVTNVVREMQSRFMSMAGSRQRYLIRAVTQQLRGFPRLKYSRNIRKPLIFVLNPARDVKFLLDRIQTRGQYRILIWNENIDPPLWIVPLSMRINSFRCPENLEAIRKDIQSAATALMDDPAYQSFFTYKGINWFDLAQTRLSHFLVNGMFEYFTYNYRARGLFSQTKPAALLFPNAGDYVDGAILDAAQHLKIPRISFQRGGVYGYSELLGFEEFEFAACDHFLTYGPGVVETLSAYDNKPQLHAVGSARLEVIARSALRKRRNLCPRNPQKPLHILYITTRRVGARRPLSLDNYSDSGLFAVQRAIIEGFRDFPEHRFTVKLHPAASATDPIVQFIKNQNLRNCRIAMRAFVERLLQRADLCILDHPSTSLLECLASGIPAIIYAGTGRLYDDAAELLKKDAVVTTNLCEVRGLLRQEIERIRQGPVTFNGSFLREYGTGVGDGTSVDRAFSIIENAIGSNAGIDDQHERAGHDLLDNLSDR